MRFSTAIFTVPPEIRARGPQALEAYNNALAEGQACVKSASDDSWTRSVW